VISTEALLTSPLGFGLDKATPVQRARCRIGDGEPLRELRTHPDVVAMCGGADAVERLPSERGIATAVIVDLSSVRSAKTMIACCRAARATQIVSIGPLKRGEVPRLSFASLKLERTRVPFRMLSALYRESPAFRPLLVGEPTADTLTVRHPSNWPIEIACVAGGRAAGGFVSDWSAGLAADEAPRMVGREEGVTNLDDMLSAIRARLLPGAQIQLIGSPWAPMGPVYELAMEHFGRPSEAIVVLRSNGPQNNPEHFTPEFCEKLQEADPVAYQCDVLGEFADPESGLLSPIAVRRNTRETPLELPPEGDAMYVGYADLADVTTTGNAATLGILEVIPSRNDEDDSASCKFRVVIARQWRGVGIETCLKDMAGICGRYGVRAIGADRYAGAANAALARRFGLTLDIEKTTAAGNLEAFTNLATIIHTDRLELPPDRVVRGDLLSVRKRATQSGYSIVLPKTADGRHADFAPALAGAVRRGSHPSLYDPDYYAVIGVVSARNAADGVGGIVVMGGSGGGMSSEERTRRFMNDEFGGR